MLSLFWVTHGDRRTHTLSISPMTLCPALSPCTYVLDATKERLTWNDSFCGTSPNGFRSSICLATHFRYLQNCNANNWRLNCLAWPRSKENVSLNYQVNPFAIGYSGIRHSDRFRGWKRTFFSQRHVRKIAWVRKQQNLLNQTVQGETRLGFSKRQCVDQTHVSSKVNWALRTLNIFWYRTLKNFLSASFRSILPFS